MSTVACCREYTQVVQALPPPPESYWKIETSSGGATLSTPDAIDSRPLSAPASGFPIIVAGGLFGNCFETMNKNVTSSSQAYNRFQSGFSMRFWIKYGGDNTFGIKITSLRGLVADTRSVQLELIQTDDPGAGPFTIKAIANAVSITPPHVLAINVWHHVVLRWDTTNVLTLTLDTVNYTAAATYNAFVAATASWNIGPVGSLPTPANIDEIATWDKALLGRLLTDAEVATDYNGGVGRTWPW